MKIAIASLLVILSSISHAEITIKELVQHENEIQFLNPKVEIVKAKDKQYYLKISQDSKRISREFLSDTSPIYSKLISGRKYFVKRQYYISLDIQSETSGIEKSYQKSIASDVDVKTNKFSNIRNRIVNDLFGTYTGFAFNAGLIIGGGYTRLENASGIRLSELNGATVYPVVGINAGLTLAEVEVTLMPNSEDVSVVYEMIMEHVNSIQKTSQTIKLGEIVERQL